MLKVVAIGEILWDIFGETKYLGGAPFNFSYFAGVLGEESRMISRIGDDELGREILTILEEKGINCDHIQIDRVHSTGTVLVDTSNPKSPGFDIVEDVAYDYMELRKEDTSLVKNSDVVCFGTLAQRNPKSRETMESLLNEAKEALVLYDINIRQNFYSKEIIENSLCLTDILKLNTEEMDFLKKLLNFDNSVSNKDVSLQIIDKYELELACVTDGDKGCHVFSEEKSVSSPGYKVKIQDTVGSGDAFAASFAIKYLKTKDIKKAADFANLIGGYVASKKGAIPEIEWREIENLPRVS